MLRTLKNLHKTFYDSRFYGELVFTWKGFGLGFLFLISLLNTIHLVVVMYEPYSAFMQEREAVFDMLPEVTIKDGVISSDNEQPVNITLLKDNKDGPIRIVIDTKNEMTNKDATAKEMAGKDIFVMVNKNAIAILSPADGSIDLKDAKDMANTQITHEKWKEISSAIVNAFAPVSLISLCFLSFVGHLITAALGALVIMLVSPLLKTRLPYAASMRLASAAKVPVAFVFLIIAPQPALQTALWFGFAVFGLFSAKNTRNQYI